MNEREAKEAANKVCFGMPTIAKNDCMKIIDVVWQAALEWRDSQVGKPFGYFKCEIDEWVGCAETDDGAIALYEGLPTAQINQQLVEAFERLLSTAERCDGWESFPRTALEDAQAALAAAKQA